MFDIEKLLTKIRDRSALVGVVGLGYVGLPFAVEKGKAGFTVIGIEVDSDRAARVNRGENYIGDVDDAELKQLVQSGQITAVTDFSRISEVDVIVVCVPTPLTRNMTPDLQFIESVTHSVAPHLRLGQLVTLESTTYPGTTEEVMLPMLEASGLKVEEDFYLAHSPERVDPGNPVFKTKNTAKVVGGVGPVSLQVATAFYGETLDNVFPVSCAKAAELSKVFENTFRAVNVGLVNELTVLCDKMGLNVWEVLDAAYTKPFGIMPFYPGPGVGGHCIPIDPHYLEWKAKEYYFETRFIATAGAINRVMPEFVRDKTLRILNANGVAAIHARVLVLGAAYKKNIDDYRESPAIEVILRLGDAGIQVCYHDPYVATFTEHGVTMESVPLTEELVRSADLVIIATDHSNIDYAWVVDSAKAVFDTRHATKGIKSEKITLL
ncbi:MAG: nucleotide sugar dehydrogenase [Solirubrobacterales bacterium]